MSLSNISHSFLRNCSWSQLFKNACSSQSLHTSAPSASIPLLYPNHKMDRDVRVRRQVKQHHFERLNLINIYRTKSLPQEIRDIASKQLSSMPLDHNYTRMHARCRVTSRPRGRVRDWKVSRFIFRFEADYNRLSGMQRAMWT